MIELEVKPLSDARKVVLWTRYGCALDDVVNLEIVKAGFEVLLSYIQMKAAHKVIFGGGFIFSFFKVRRLEIMTLLRL